MVLFDYPKNAALDKPLPKNKIYDKAKPSSSIKQLFIQQLEQIVWKYKLAPETINLPATLVAPEIQIFTIVLREKDLKCEVLRCIDQAIPLPIIYELYFEGKIKVVAAYKRPSATDNSKWVVSDYFESAWLPSDTSRISLPIAFDLELLYTNLLTPLLPYPAFAGERLHAHIDRIELILKKECELKQCEARLGKEKQFNKKVAINAELRALKQLINTLRSPSEGCQIITGDA